MEEEKNVIAEEPVEVKIEGESTPQEIPPNVTIILSAVGIYRGNYNQKFQYYQVLGKDSAGRQFVITFATPHPYVERVERSFKVLLPVPVTIVEPNKEEVKQNEQPEQSAN
jgi:hypothetical protein